MRPQFLTKNFVLQIIAATGKHIGVFQLVDFHEKKTNIYSCYISDGYFRLKVIFLDQAGLSIANGHVANYSVISAEVYNYSFEEGVYLVKSINEQWRYTRKIGEPKEWRHKKLNSNPIGSNEIQWPPEDEVQPVPFTFSERRSANKPRQLMVEEQSGATIPEVSSQGEHSNSSFGETQQAHPKSRQSLIVENQQEQVSSSKKVANDFKLEFQQASRLSSSKKSLMVEPPQSPRPANTFTDDDFLQLSYILSAQSKARRSGVKQRASTNSQSLNDLLELLETQQLIEDSQEKIPGATAPTVDMVQVHSPNLKLEQINPNEDKREPIDESENLSELLQLMELPHEQSDRPTELLKSPVSSSNITALVSSSKKDEELDHQLQQLIKEDEFDDLLAFMDNFEKTEITIRKESKIKMTVMPLAALYPDAEGWSIYIQVLAKSSVTQREFGSRTIASFVCLFRDVYNNIVEGVFTDRAVHQLIEQGKYYLIENGCVCASRNTVAGCLKFTIEFNSKLVLEQAHAFPMPNGEQRLSECYTSLKDVFSLPVDTFVHIVGILRDVSVLTYQKEGVSKSRTTFVIVDPLSNSEIELVDFGRLRSKVTKLQVISIYNAKITKYREIKGLVVTFNTIIKEGNECLPFVNSLSQFCDEGFLDNLVPVYSFQTRQIQELKQLEKRLLQNQSIAVDFSSELTGSFTTFFKERMYYLSCPQCRKKLQLRSDNKYICLKCKDIKQPCAKYLLSGSFGDRTGMIPITVEERLVRHLLQMTADEFWRLQTQRTQASMEAYRNIINLEGRLLTLQVTGWLTEFDGQKKVNYTCRSIRLVQPTQHCQHLLHRVTKFIEYI